MFVWVSTAEDSLFCTIEINQSINQSINHFIVIKHDRTHTYKREIEWSVSELKTIAMSRISTQENYSIETMARPSRNSCTAYALRNYSQKDVLSVQETKVSVHAVLDCSSVMRWMVVVKGQMDTLLLLLILLWVCSSSDPRLSWSGKLGWQPLLIRGAAVGRVVNIAVLVMLPTVSEYGSKYRRYFSYAVSIWVSAILFHLFFGNIRYQYFVVRCTS